MIKLRKSMYVWSLVKGGIVKGKVRTPSGIILSKNIQAYLQVGFYQLSILTEFGTVYGRHLHESLYS